MHRSIRRLSLTVAIRPAATAVLVAPPAPSEDPTTGAWRTLLVQRHSKARFMRSAWVFPGGCLEDDIDIRREASSPATAQPSAAEGEAADVNPAVVQTGTPGTRLDDFRRCAIREVQEEAGVVLDSDPAALRRLAPMSHWTTPSNQRYRYNAWFFAAPLPTPANHGEQQLPPLQLCEREIADAQWLTPAEALKRHVLGYDGFALALTTLLVLEAAAQLWPRHDHALEVIDGARHPLRVPGDIYSNNTDSYLPGHATPVGLTDSAGVHHWFVDRASAAPHLDAGASYPYWASADLYGADGVTRPDADAHHQQQQRLQQTASPSGAQGPSSWARTAVMVHVQ